MASRRPRKHKPIDGKLTPDQTTGSRVRDWREQAGMDGWEFITAVAKVAGRLDGTWPISSIAKLSEIENGKRRATRDQLEWMALALRDPMATKTPVHVMPEDFTRNTGRDGLDTDVRIEGVTARATAAGKT